MGTFDTVTFEATPAAGLVSARVGRPPDARWGYVLAHGAGAGMHHAFMEATAVRLHAHGVATFRYQFAYVERGGRRPDPRPVLLHTVRSAVDAARRHLPDLPLVAGGKSMGGRMTSLAQSEEPLPGIRGIAFLGFPLHPPRRPAVDRAEHLERVDLPLLFVQGTRDELADLTLLTPILDGLAPRATLHVVEGADHGFHVLKRSGRTDEEVLDELTGVLDGWARSRVLAVRDQ
jgi:hypothetical protein